MIFLFMALYFFIGFIITMKFPSEFFNGWMRDVLESILVLWKPKTNKKGYQTKNC